MAEGGPNTQDSSCICIHFHCISTDLLCRRRLRLDVETLQHHGYFVRSVGRSHQHHLYEACDYRERKLHVVITRATLIFTKFSAFRERNTDISSARRTELVCSQSRPVLCSKQTSRVSITFQATRVSIEAPIVHNETKQPVRNRWQNLSCSYVSFPNFNDIHHKTLAP